MARVPYVESEDVPERHRDLLVSSLQDRPLHVYRALGNNPAVLAGLRGFLSSLWSDSGLNERRRELVILAVTREIENEYEFHQHVNIARDVGIDDETIAAISEGEFDAFDAGEATLLRYAVAVVRARSTTESTRPSRSTTTSRRWSGSRRFREPTPASVESSMRSTSSRRKGSSAGSREKGAARTASSYRRKSTAPAARATSAAW